MGDRSLYMRSTGTFEIGALERVLALVGWYRGTALAGSAAWRRL
jgi:hypothetical protein